MKRGLIFLCCPLLLLTACAGRSASTFSGRGGGASWAKDPAVVLVVAKSDPRLPVVGEAIDFWNRTLAELGTSFRLGPVVHLKETVPIADLQALSAQVEGRWEPVALPEGLHKMPGEIIVVLSEGDFISFAARSLSGAKVVVGIKSRRFHPLTLPNVEGNVLAHELGHALGLRHNDHPATLMCGRPAPCRPEVFQSLAKRFFPLTEDEKKWLRTMYPPG